MHACARPFVDSLVWLPFGWFDKELADRLRTRLTIIPKEFTSFGGRRKADEEDEEEDTKQPIPTYTVDRERRVVGVPIHFGTEYLKRCNKLQLLEDRRTDGLPMQVRRLPDPNHPRVKDPELQARFMQDLLRELPIRGTMLAEADTGTGKTVVALWLAGKLGRSTLVVVPSKQLVKQWVNEAITHLGFTPEEVGTVVGGKAKYQGKSIVIALVHNLRKEGRWPKDFYDRFGFVVWDEAHRLGAKSFAASMRQFPARYKLALTATPKRKDGCERIFTDYFGNPSVVSEAEALPAICYVHEYQRKGNKIPPFLCRARVLSLLALDPERNSLLVNGIICPLYDRGRYILVLSDRVSHLQALMVLCIAAGIPEKDMGLYVSAYDSDEMVTIKARDGRTKKVAKKVEFSQEHLDHVEANAIVIFATYGMLKEGKSIQRLDAGVDATPRAEGEQSIGRIRRPMPGKPIPEWHTIKDLGNALALRSFYSRIKEYRACNVTVIDSKNQP